MKTFMIVMLWLTLVMSAATGAMIGSQGTTAIHEIQGILVGLQATIAAGFLVVVMAIDGTRKGEKK